MKAEEKTLHDKAWNLLEEKGLKLTEMMMVRSHFAAAFKEEYPFIEHNFKKGEIVYYNSSYDLIKNCMFKTEEEVILANAIYLNMNEGNGINEFRELFKFTCKIIGLDSDWTQ